MSEIKLEYIDSLGNPRAYIYNPDYVSGQTPNVDLRYLDDTRFLFDPNNGYVDDEQNPTEKMYSLLKYVESVNASTWEYVIANSTILDKRPLRGGKTRAVPTRYNISGDPDDLITGIGDNMDIQVLEIEQVNQPEIMSRDLFISNLSGFVTGGTSGIVTEIDYSEILNPVNTDNVNNYYPIVHHGYFYSGETEYYLYGTKDTEIFQDTAYNSIDPDGYRRFLLSGQPNTFSPIIMNSQSGEIYDLLGDIDINDFHIYHQNAYRTSYSGTVQIEQHNLRVDNPFAYIVGDNGDISLPKVEALNLNRGRITTVDPIEGTLNIIRPNKFFRRFEIDNPYEEIIEHGLYSDDIFAVIAEDDTGDLAFPDILVIDKFKVEVTADVKGILILFNLNLLSTGMNVSNFTSGQISTPLTIPPSHEAYVDPWVIGEETDGELALPTSTVVDDNGIVNVTFSVPFTGEIRLLGFSEINQAGVLFDDHTFISTEMFPMTDNEFRGNNGLGNPVHRTYPLPDNQSQVISCYEFDMLSGCTWLSGETYKPDWPIYETSTNMLVVPPRLSGHVVVSYERQDREQYPFHDADCSPVTWYNSDRVLALQIEPLEPDSIEIIPDFSQIKTKESPTTPLSGLTEPLPLSNINDFYVSGEPLTSMNATIFVVDKAGSPVSGETIKVCTGRKLYNDVSGNTAVSATFDIEDNTSELMGLSNSMLSQMSGEVTTNSIFDIITLDDIPISGQPIYDQNGYLFHTISGVTEYKVPFIGATHVDEVGFVHEHYIDTNKFGTANITLGFHNNPLQYKNKILNVHSCVSGNTEVCHNTNIIVVPYKTNDTFGYTLDGEPSVNIHTNGIYNSNFTPLENDVLCVSNVFFETNEDFNDNNGVITPSVSNMSGIITTFQIDDKYWVYHNSTSGEIGYYKLQEIPAMLNVGDVYGAN